LEGGSISLTGSRGRPLVTDSAHELEVAVCAVVEVLLYTDLHRDDEDSYVVSAV